MVALLILALLLLASPAEAQSLDEYLALLHSYATDPDRAVDQLSTAQWRQQTIDRNVRACQPAKNFGGDASPCNVRLRALSAALHAEVAGRIIVDDSGRAAFHLEMARRMANFVRDRPAFTEKWYEFVTMQQSSPRTGARPVVLVFTDGLDTSSWLTEGEVLNAADRAGSVVHILTTEPGAFFDSVASASGGRTWRVNADGLLPKWFEEALTEMRSRYLLSYSPTGASTPGWHALRVRVKNRSVDVNARRGYFVNP